MTQTVPPIDPTLTPAGIADRLAAAVRPFIGGDLPVRLQAWDGSVAGPAGAPLVVLRSPDALRRLLWHPGAGYAGRVMLVDLGLGPALAEVQPVVSPGRRHELPEPRNPMRYG